MSDWYSAEQHAQKAHEHFEAGEWDLALVELRRALELNPFESDWHFGMGLTLDAMERYSEAVGSFEEALRLRGVDVDTMLHLGVDLVRSNQCRRAIEMFERIRGIDPECEAAYCHSILAHAHLGEHDQAELLFYMARQLVEECPVCFDHVAESLAMRGQMERAIWCWRQVLRLDPHFPDVYANLARASWQRRQFDQARQFFVRQLRENPGDIETRLQMGAMLMEMNRPEEAQQRFAQAVELDPTVAEAHLRLGEIALLAGKLETAQAELEIARQLEPERAGVRLRLAQVARQRDQPSLAQELLEAELECTDRAPEEAIELARHLLEAGMSVHAERLMSRLIETEGEHLDRQNMAMALLYRGSARLLESDAATRAAGIRDCRKCLRLAPHNVLAMCNLVMAYTELKSFKRARYFLVRAREEYPEDRSLLQLRARLLRAGIQHRLARVSKRMNHVWTRCPKLW